MFIVRVSWDIRKKNALSTGIFDQKLVNLIKYILFWQLARLNQTHEGMHENAYVSAKKRAIKTEQIQTQHIRINTHTHTSIHGRQNTSNNVSVGER